MYDVCYVLVMAEQQPADEAVAEYLERFRATYREMRASIPERFPDPVVSVFALDDLDRKLLALHNKEMSLMKALEVVRSNELEPGSLGQLGKRHNRSKSRIDQYFDIAAEAAEEEPCTSATTT
jgi:hypothetical protein